MSATPATSPTLSLALVVTVALAVTVALVAGVGARGQYIAHDPKHRSWPARALVVSATSTAAATRGAFNGSGRDLERGDYGTMLKHTFPWNRSSLSNSTHSPLITVELGFLQVGI